MSCWTKEELENMLEDVVNELDLSEVMIEKHGQEGTTPPQFEKNKSRFKKGEIPWNKGKRQKPPTHGTLYEYFKGCRCSECKKANTEYCAKKRLS